MARKGGLGKGLGALIPDNSISQNSEGTNLVAVERIVPNPRQPRHRINDAELEELAASIREHGILQPLLVSYDAENDSYILVAGERRLRAASLAGLESVPVLVRQVTEQQRLELALIENVQRSDLTPLETAEAFRQLNEEFGLSHEEIANQVGKSRVAVTNTLRLLKLPEAVRKALAEEKITEGHARALAGLGTSQAQVGALQTVLNLSLTVRQTEELVRKLNGEKIQRTPKAGPPSEIIDLEEKLRNALGTKVNIRHGKKGGLITVRYYSEEELEALVHFILKE
jgi:ParB family transcriptional regulator, chromosome partitioning protein